MKSIEHIWQLLKNRWGIESNIQVGIILLSFGLSGFSTLFSHNFIDELLGITDETPFWIELVVFIVLILPIFNLFLLFWGTLLGQKKFVIEYIRTKIYLITKWKFKGKND